MLIKRGREKPADGDQPAALNGSLAAGEHAGRAQFPAGKPGYPELTNQIGSLILGARSSKPGILSLCNRTSGARTAAIR